MSNQPNNQVHPPRTGDASGVDVATTQPAPNARRSFFALRREIPQWQAILFGLVCLAIVLVLWWLATRGTPEERIFSPSILPSPVETVDSFHSLWFDRALTRNAYASLRRVALGFGLAALVGVPMGVLCGCFPWFKAFLGPITIFGRYIPIAALIPLTYSFFGIGEQQKIMFIFIASVAFVISDAARAVTDVSDRYIDTAYTLGASRRQIILKVLVPLSLPSIFNSLRLLFGLAFGYIMLAELIKFGDSPGGLGDIINVSQHRGLQSHILLVLMIIPVVAMGIDRLFYWVQRELFPYQYGGSGILLQAVRGCFYCWEGFKSLIIRP